MKWSSIIAGRGERSEWAPLPRNRLTCRTLPYDLLQGHAIQHFCRRALAHAQGESLASAEMVPLVDAGIDEMRRWLVLGVLRCCGARISRSGKVCSILGRRARGGNRRSVVHGVEEGRRTPPVVRHRTEL